MFASKSPVKPACSLDTEEVALPWSPQTDPVDKSAVSIEAAKSKSENVDCESPEFWLDICSDIPTNSHAVVNLGKNPEKWTG